ncbi:MAG: hypothetical protein ACI8TL_002095 [Natronomonas sp.]|jgi:hypothetical protein
MNRYERQYGTDWETLDPDEAVDRAYALGVAATMAEYHPDELDAIREEMDSSYNTSMVELAFQEGKKESREIDEEETENAWNELVVGEVPLEPDDLPMGGRSGLPEAITLTEALDRPDRDSTDAVDLPEFLK